MVRYLFFIGLVLHLCLFSTVILNASADDSDDDDDDDNEFNGRDIFFSTCARMNDGAIGSKAARAACISSCKFQNCGTGYCQNRGRRPTCVCSRCGGGGGEWPNLPGK